MSCQILVLKGLILSGQVVIKKGDIVDSEKFQVLYSLKQRYEGEILEKEFFFICICWTVYVGWYIIINSVVIFKNNTEEKY